MRRLISRTEVGRVIQLGGSVYMLVPAGIARAAGVKRGDRMCIRTDGARLYCARLNFEQVVRATQASG